LKLLKTNSSFTTATLELGMSSACVNNRSDGTLFFTDPPFGLPKAFDDVRKELPFSGVYSLKDGRLTLAATDLTGPNGPAFSPDERYLYVANWDEKKKVVMRYRAQPDGTLTAARSSSI
jgi:gluconolactonase